MSVCRQMWCIRKEKYEAIKWNKKGEFDFSIEYFLPDHLHPVSTTGKICPGKYKILVVKGFKIKIKQNW